MNFSQKSKAAMAAAALLAAAACTSQEDDAVPDEYRQAHALWQKLLTRHGTEEAAAMDPNAADVRVLLNRCKKGSRRAGTGQEDLCGEFYARIDAAKKRAQQRQSGTPASQKFRPADAIAAPSRMNADAPRSSETPSSAAPAATNPPASAAPDAGTPKPPSEKPAPENAVLPKRGMKAGEFNARFGACFTHFSDLTVTGVGTGQAMILKDDEDCRSILPGFDKQAVLIADGVVESIRNLDELKPVLKITYGEREITLEQKECLEKNQEREKQGLAKLPCLPGDDPYGPAAGGEDVAIESL